MKVEEIIKHIRQLASINSIWWTSHGAMRMLKRNITREEVKYCMINGEIIETYIDDKPFPSYLLFARVNEKNLHVVIGVDSDKIHVVTAYEPNSKVFEKDFKTRKK